MPRCKKCGDKYPKTKLDNVGLCRYCSDDLNFRAKMCMISSEESKKIRKENEFWDTIENNNHEFDFVPFFIGVMIFTAAYLFCKQPFEKAVFLNSLLCIIIVAVLAVIVYGFSIAVIKPILLSILDYITTLKGVKIFIIISFVAIAIVSALIITIKSVI